MGRQTDHPEHVLKREAASADERVFRWRSPCAWFCTVVETGLAALCGGFLAVTTLSLAFRTGPEPTNAFQLAIIAAMWILVAKLVGGCSLRISFMRHAKLTLTSRQLIYVDNRWRRAALNWDSIEIEFDGRVEVIDLKGCVDADTTNCYNQILDNAQNIEDLINQLSPGK